MTLMNPLILLKEEQINHWGKFKNQTLMGKTLQEFLKIPMKNLKFHEKLLKVQIILVKVLKTRITKFC
jgi:hypothetical protein